MDEIQGGPWLEGEISSSEAQATDSRGSLGLTMLHCPSRPLIELVFVHGLGGGSRKTWSKTSSMSHFWPKTWLPKDAAFQNARVHSFGYFSDYVKGRDNILDIRHFGRSLLGALNTSPHMLDSDTPIIFIGHSMGGLVIKKAYLLGKQDPLYRSLIRRFYSMYFLATPHRGADSAKILNNILQVTYSSRAFVTDLKRGSQTIRSINDEFSKCSTDIELWSFYETQKLSIGGLFKILIADPNSATLGYPGERQMPMNADHRSICKFEEETDEGYLTIRNSLVSTLESALQLRLKAKEKLRDAQMKDLATFLGIFKDPEDEFRKIEDIRLPGTCEWIDSKKYYLRWKDLHSEVSKVLWLKGNPATGKSVLAGYIIENLRKAGACCNFFFFKYGEKSRTRLGTCLKSLAFQMACHYPQVREKMLDMMNDDVNLDYDSERNIWRKLFLNSIFPLKLPRSHWIIDGLDECADVPLFFETILAKLNDLLQLNIVILSQETLDIDERLSNLPAHQFQLERIMPIDTFSDMKLVVESKAKYLTAKDDGHNVKLLTKILKNSQGCFLWAILVLEELSSAYSEKEIGRVLDDVPPDMEQLYKRKLDSMSQNTRGKELAKAVLNWTVCVTRPLTLKELELALKLELNDSFPRLRESVLALCGQLVFIDKFENVQMVHETAREFLLSESLDSEFAIDKAEVHTRITCACLSYLLSQEMRPPRGIRQGYTTKTTVKRADFSNYACIAFSYHLKRANPVSNEVFRLLNDFLKLNIFSWIEAVALTRNLTPLIKAAKRLKAYSDARSTQKSPLGTGMQIIRGWIIDLVRISGRFADALIIAPWSIYSLIPPFCPKETMIYKRVSSGRTISVVGLSTNQWDDRFSCIHFHTDQTSAICYGHKFLAVALTNGKISLYHSKSCQEHVILDHGEAVRFLQIKATASLIVSCGMEMIRIWDLSHGELRHTLKSPQRPMALEIIGSLLLAAGNKNCLASWDLENNCSRLPDRSWDQPGEYTKERKHGTTCAMSISVAHEMLAVAYVGTPVILLDISEDMYFGTCGKKLSNGKTSTHLVTALAFNPNINISLLAISYLDGELVLVDPYNDQVIESFRANCHILAASPNGKLLAGAAGSGMIQIYEFDTLTLLYRIQSSNFHIKRLVFSEDSLQFADIRGSLCNIWKPPILLRDQLQDASSDNTSTSIQEGTSTDNEVKICAILVEPDRKVVFCGEENGFISLFDLKTGAKLRTLYQHKSPVRLLLWGSSNDIVISIDASNKIFSWKLRHSQTGELETESLVFEGRLNSSSSIIQVLVGREVEKMILLTRASDHLWSLHGHEESVKKYVDQTISRKWIQHPYSPTSLICFTSTVASIYAWKDFSMIVSVKLNLDATELQLRTLTTVSSKGGPLIFLELADSANKSNLFLFDAHMFDVEKVAKKNKADEEIKAGQNTDIMISFVEQCSLETPRECFPIIAPQLTAVAPKMAHIIGVSASRKLVFLDHYSWVCSIDLENPPNLSGLFARHFFAPYDWFAGRGRDVICAVNGSDILLTRDNDLVIIQDGLTYFEDIIAKSDTL